MLTQVYRNPEPVPLVSQLAVLPFLSGVDGLLRENGEVAGLRITVHRVMSREGQGYLQQVLTKSPKNRSDALKPPARLDDF